MTLRKPKKPTKMPARALTNKAAFDRRAWEKMRRLPGWVSRSFKVGWLESMAGEVTKFRNGRMLQRDSLELLSRQVPDFHVGGKTALAWRGVRREVPAEEPLCLWGDRVALPGWFGKRTAVRYRKQNLFSAKLPKDFGLQPWSGTGPGVLVSTPERALLEMLSEVGLHQGIEEARVIMGSTGTLDPEALIGLLNHCCQFKVVLLCALWADELALPWALEARKIIEKWSEQRPRGC
jgi:hypothetical protein